MALRAGDILLFEPDDAAGALVRWWQGTGPSHVSLALGAGQYVQAGPPIIRSVNLSFFYGRRWVSVRPRIGLAPCDEVTGARVAAAGRVAIGQPYSIPKLLTFLPRLSIRRLFPIPTSWLVCSSVPALAWSFGAGLIWRADDGTVLDPLRDVTPLVIASQWQREGWDVTGESADPPRTF